MQSAGTDKLGRSSIITRSSNITSVFVGEEATKLFKAHLTTVFATVAICRMESKSYIYLYLRSMW